MDVGLSRQALIRRCMRRLPTSLQDVAIEAAKGAVVLAIMERLLITRPSHWLEVRPSR